MKLGLIFLLIVMKWSLHCQTTSCLAHALRRTELYATPKAPNLVPKFGRMRVLVPESGHMRVSVPIIGHMCAADAQMAEIWHQGSCYFRYT